MIIKFKIFYFITIISLISADYLFSKHAQVLLHPYETENSYFGFAVQLQASNGNDGRLIVGAPRSSDINYKNLTEPGAVFSCSLDTKICGQFDLDSEGTTDANLASKNYSSLGFSLDTDDTFDGRLLACAPRWIDIEKNKYPIPQQNGMCYYIQNAENIKPNKIDKLMPLQSQDLQYDWYNYNYILGQSGFSSHLIKGEETIVLTAVGVHNWTGSVIQYHEQDENNFKMYEANAKTFGKIETYSYFGYSLAYGRFNTSDPGKVFYVSGAPRNTNLFGSVYVYEKLTTFGKLYNRFQFPGKQFGEYFGASVAVADLNGDGIDDVVIGAPMYSTDEKVEAGCIYPYITQKTDENLQKNIKFQTKDRIEGEERGSRFGTAISSVGDINKDGYEDIVVGAPYYDEKGAIYLYLGQKNKNTVLKFGQKILASECNPNLRGFGFSLSRGLDIDNNFYNDIAVGSYLSSHAVVLKSRPIISVSTRLEADIKQIDVNTRKFILSSCLVYTAKDVPTEQYITIDLQASHSQIIFENTEKYYNRNISYKKNEEHCENVTLTVNVGLMDAVTIFMNYRISNNEYDFCKMCATEETGVQKEERLTIPFSKGCAGNICKTNLKLSASFNLTEQSLVIGSTSEIQLNIAIENLGEHSFGTKLSMQLSSYQISVKSDSVCSQTLNIVNCNFITPLTSKTTKDLVFILNVENLSTNETYLNVTMSVTSISEDTDTKDNNYMLGLPLSTDVKFNIATKSEPEQLVMSENITTKQFIHTYNIESTGKTDLDNLNVYFYIPYQYNDKIIADNIEISGCIQQNKEVIDATFEMSSNEVLENTINLNCSSTQTKNLKCRRIQCEIKDDTKLKIAKINISLDVILPVFKQETDSILLATTLQTNSPYLSDMKSYARSTLIPEPQAASITAYLIIGVAVGLLLILILGVILYKIGFFKRKRPMKPEDEVLLEKKDEPGTSTQVEIGEENKQNGGNTIRKEDDIMKEESDG